MITKLSIKETTGNNFNVAQSFKQNVFFETRVGKTLPSIFNKPKYTTIGGTKNYYGQDNSSIFTSLVKPFIKFEFTENISSFNSNVFIKHDIYRIDWDLIKKINEKDEDRELIIQKINEKTKKPITCFIYPTTGITTNFYDLKIEQYIKNIGDYKTELFQDKSQYIIDTNFIFNINVTPNLKDYQTKENGNIITYDYKEVYSAETFSDEETINSGIFSGITFKKGDYFTYFQIPDKPYIEFPSPTGETNTFTPEIFWSNGENADNYLIQVTYNTGDTSFSGEVFNYNIPKLDKYKEKSNNTKIESEEDFSSEKTIRKFQISLKSNKNALYRIGNVKEIINIFEKKQSVVTFSDAFTIKTQDEPIKTFVFSESDSKFTSNNPTFYTPPSLIFEDPIEEYSLSGLVSGSIVSGATIQIIYPNSNFITTTTNELGEFYINYIQSGVYTINTNYRGYMYDSRIINITGNTNIEIEIETLWDNEFDFWFNKENDIIKN